MLSTTRPIITLLLLLCLSSPALAQNRVLELDGDSSYVQLPGHIFDELDEATVEAWVKWDDWAFFSQWFAFGIGDLGWNEDRPWTAMGMNHFDTTSILQFFIYTGRQELRVLRLKLNLPLGQWCHMAAVSGRGGMRFYLNGVLVEQNGYKGSFAALGPGSDNYLGKSSWQDNAYFRGQLDEVRVWSVARTSEQIRTAMAQRLSGSEKDLVGLWNFDAGDVRDISPQGHAGQLRGNARCVKAPFPGEEAVFRPALVQGTVRDETGVPLVSAVVRLKKADEVVVSARTWQDGHYSLAVFGEGAYTLDTWLESAVLQWAYSGEQRPPVGAAGPQPQEVFLQEGAVLRRDLSLPPTRVAWWRGEGDARDAVGPHHGTLQGGTTFAPGLVGQAFSLDGVDDLIRVRHAASLNMSGGFSLVAWVFPTTDKLQQIFCKWGHESRLTSDQEYQLYLAPGLRVYFTLSGQVELLSPGNVLKRNVWNQVAAVYDHAAGSWRTYVNGMEVAERQNSSVTLPRENADLTLGGTASDWFFQGLIDEVSIYQRPLADIAVQYLYSARAEARWSGEGNADDTRGGNNGTLVKDMKFAPGLVGQAFSFDGQGSYVEFNPIIGNFGTADFTLELWLWRGQEDKISEPILVKYFDRAYMIYRQKLIGDEEYNALDLHLDESGRVQVELNGGRDGNRFPSTRPLSVQQWHHLALVRQDSEVRLYLDGRLDTLHTATRVADLSLPVPLTLGAAPAQERYFHGLIDEVALHNRALATDAIQHTYETTLNAWRWRLWRGRLEKGGIGLVVVLALLSSARYYTQRKARRQRELQLAEERRAREVADAANQAKSAFLANMSHEIRTPMNAILGYTQILKTDPDLSARQNRAIEAVATSGDHLLELINDVLDLSKIEAGRMDLQLVDFDLAQLVQGLAIMFQVRCQQQGLGWRVEQEGENWQVRGDENKLRQVLINLLGNAVKFTEAGEVVLRVQVEEGLYHFAVQDTGPGIAPQQQATLFEPFQQGVSGADKGGTGLGLTIARRHVELMGGELQLASALGQGARFFFALPLGAAEGPVDEEAEERYGQVVRLAAGFAPQVLIVDDVATNREVLAQILERIGVQVRQVDSGAAALGAVGQARPDLVFMDIRMPGMDGVEALRRLRQEHGALPVVAVSASVLAHEQTSYLESGFDGFLDKPFRLEHLYACLEEVLGVDYEYAEPDATGAPAPVDFAGLRLPAPLRSRLLQAAEMRNVTAVKGGLEELQGLGAEASALAAHLGQLVQRFDLAAVVQVVENTVEEREGS